PRASPAFQTTQTFALDAGRATRTFTLHERGGVILVNRLTVSHGVRAFVEARIPGLAGARVLAGQAATTRRLCADQAGRSRSAPKAKSGARCHRRYGTSASSNSAGLQDRCASTTSLPRHRPTLRSTCASRRSLLKFEPGPASLLCLTLAGLAFAGAAA